MLPGFLGGTVGKNPPVSAGGIKERVQSLGPKYPLEKEMATHSSMPAEEIPWTKEPDKLQSHGVTKSQV